MCWPGWPISATRSHSEEPESSFGFGGAQLIQRIEGGYIGGSDPRKDGCVIGF